MTQPYSQGADSKERRVFPCPLPYQFGYSLTKELSCFQKHTYKLSTVVFQEQNVMENSCCSHPLSVSTFILNPYISGLAMHTTYRDNKFANTIRRWGSEYILELGMSLTVLSPEVQKDVQMENSRDFVYLCAHMCACMCTCLYMYNYLCMCLHLCMCVFVCLCVSMHVSVCVSVSL